jgi:class 3 adenylate cyclase
MMPSEPLAADTAKELRTLRRTVARLENARATHEAMWDRNSNLFRKLTAEIEERNRVIENQKDQLTMLATKLAKYLSPQVYDNIFSGEREVRIETYSKPLTVFFSDIADFTPRSDTLPPAELAGWLNEYLNDMAEICLRYQGTLDKFIGDAVMVFFGDPRTLGPEEDAAQCIRMAKDMMSAAKQRNVDIRVGIHSGECVVGNFGSDSRMDYTVVGSNVNIAARMEKASERGRILISDATWRLLGGSCRGEHHGEIMLKGLKQPVMTHWIL